MSLYRPNGSKIYWMDFHYHGQRIRESTSMASVTRAKEVQTKRQQGLRDGSAGIRKPEAPRLFSVAAAEWIERKKLRWSASMVTICGTAMKHVLPAFGKRLVVDMEARDISRYQKARVDQGAAPRSVNIEVALVRGLLKDCGVWGRIGPHVEMLRERDDSGHAVTSDEEAALMAECATSRSRALLPFVVLALETGARSGTLQRLQWGHVDLGSRYLTFGRDKTASGSGRTIPLTPRAAETLAFWSQSFPDRQPDHYVFPSERVAASGAEETFGFVHGTTYQTFPTRPTGSLKTAWIGARRRTRLHCPQCKAGRLALEKPGTGYVCGACGLRTTELPPGVQVRIHDLRHSAASRLIAARVPLPIVGKLLGWSAGTLAKMAARYGHFSLEEMRAAVESVRRPDFGEGTPKSPQSRGDLAEGPIQ